MIIQTYSWLLDSSKYTLYWCCVAGDYGPFKLDWSSQSRSWECPSELTTLRASISLSTCAFSIETSSYVNFIITITVLALIFPRLDDRPDSQFLFWTPISTQSSGCCVIGGPLRINCIWMILPSPCWPYWVLLYFVSRYERFGSLAQSPRPWVMVIYW